MIFLNAVISFICKSQTFRSMGFIFLPEKVCLESKGLNFCGECKDFPCEVLSTMGKEYGYDPSIKVQQCRECHIIAYLFMVFVCSVVLLYGTGVGKLILQIKNYRSRFM